MVDFKKTLALLVAFMFSALAFGDAKVAGYNGAPSLYVEGKPVPALLYYFTGTPDRWWEKTHKDVLHYYLENGHPQKMAIDNFSKAGIHIFGCPFGLGWMGPDKYDFRLTDKAAEELLKADPSAYILPRINVSVPGWWKKAHPEEMSSPMNDAPSMHSALWRRDMEAALTAFLEHIARQPYKDRVLGYVLCGGGGSLEWYTHYDFGPVSRKAFKDFLVADDKSYAETDVTIPKLKSTGYHPYVKYKWDISGKDYVETGDKYMFLDPAKDKLLSKYIQFQNEGVVDAISFFADVIKRRTEGKAIVGAWYGNVFLAHGFEFRHKASSKLYSDGNIDFIVTPLQYYNRQPGGCMTSQSLPASIRLNGKMLFSEDDQRTFLVERRKQDREGNYGQASDLLETIGVIKRNFAYTAMTQTGMWWTDMRDRGDWYANDDMMKTIATCQEVYDSVWGKDKPVSQVAVFVGEDSFYKEKLCDKFNYFGLYCQVAANLPRMGAPFDLYFTDDLKKKGFPFENYKLFVFLNAFHLPKGDKDIIKERIMRNGNTVLWYYASGFITEDALSIKDMSELVGMDLKMDAVPRRLRVKVEPSAAGREILGAVKPVPSALFAQSLKTWPKEAHPYDEAESLEYGTDDPVAPVFWCEDAAAVKLGSLVDGGETGFCMKRMQGWNSIWSCAPNLPFNVLREIARFSKVHIYCEAPDMVMASRRLIAIHAVSSGEKTVSLLRRSDVYDPFEKACVGKGLTQFKVALKAGQTALYMLEPLD